MASAVAFVSLLVFIAFVAPAGAQERRALYIGFQQGLTLPSTLTAPLAGNSQPTRCDSLLYANGAPPAADCPSSDPRQIYSTDFDLGAGYAGGVQVGYGWSRIRLEAEYLVHFQGADASPIYATDDLVSTGKAREWNPDAPPFARVSDVRAHQLFANVYYDLVNGSRWTPFVGAGVGVARTSLHYGNRYVRRTLAQGYFPIGGVDPATTDAVPEWQRNAAGTVSAVGADVTDTVLGYQLLGGVDYALTDRVSVGARVRWARFEAASGEFVWDLVRSHEPVLADGVTPYALGLEVDGLQHLGLGLGIRIGF